MHRSFIASALAAALLCACGDDGATGGGGSGGGAGGLGGEGGDAFPNCNACSPPNDICVDAAACADTCPDGRAACDTQSNDELGDLGAYRICCPGGATCCPGVGFSFCGEPGEGCPVVCPDGSTCAEGEQCQPQPFTGDYRCEAECPYAQDCGELCCPLGSQCVDGECPLADISVDEDYLAASLQMVQRDFSNNPCELQEGCIDDTGVRKLLRFSLRTPNTGLGDLFLGRPELSDLFEYSPCHDHYHFKGYAEYRLLDDQGQQLAMGHKQAFCLLDLDPLSDQSGPPIYDCGFQGIQAGWSDIYDQELPCQWVDVTDLAPGTYQLEVRLNYEHTLAESNYDNDSAVFPIVIEPDSCPDGCRPTDATCCADGDPCGWADSGSCDCGGFYDWDLADCRTCLACDQVTTCAGGCTLSTDPCCAPGDPCGNANDHVCDCEGTQDWDQEDCTSCISSDLECANVNTCPNGCSGVQGMGPCCDPDNPCGYDNDGWCDCNGTTTWDFADCTNCTTEGC